MGIFSQDKTTTNQTAYNQQIGLSNRDLSGAQLTSGGGSVTSFGTGGLSVGGGGSSAIYTQGGGASIGGGSTGNTITVHNALDPSALNTFAGLINNALTANTANEQTAATAFQNALSASGEHPQSAGQLGSGGYQSPLASTTDSGGGGGGGFSPPFGLTPGKILIVGAVAAAGLFLFFKFRK